MAIDTKLGPIECDIAFLDSMTLEQILKKLNIK